MKVNPIMRRLITAVLRAIACLFFDRRYLRGRWFDDRPRGWRWVWRSIWLQKILGFNRRVPWPVSPLMTVSEPANVEFDPDDLNVFQIQGCYLQNPNAVIHIGKGVLVAPNVGIITSNHDPGDLTRHQPGEDVFIGDECWLGMNAVILPGVRLGDRTVVGAGAVVTKSFPEGHCVIGGVPAKLIRRLDLSRLHRGEGLRA